jgi:hypothetical protein
VVSALITTLKNFFERQLLRLRSFEVATNEGSSAAGAIVVVRTVAHEPSQEHRQE